MLRSGTSALRFRLFSHTPNQELKYSEMVHQKYESDPTPTHADTASPPHNASTLTLCMKDMINFNLHSLNYLLDSQLEYSQGSN